MFMNTHDICFQTQIVSMFINAYNIYKYRCCWHASVRPSVRPCVCVRACVCMSVYGARYSMMFQSMLATHASLIETGYRNTRTHACTHARTHTGQQCSVGGLRRIFCAWYDVYRRVPRHVCGSMYRTVSRHLCGCQLMYRTVYTCSKTCV